MWFISFTLFMLCTVLRAAWDGKARADGRVRQERRRPSQIEAQLSLRISRPTAIRAAHLSVPRAGLLIKHVHARPNAQQCAHGDRWARWGSGGGRRSRSDCRT